MTYLRGMLLVMNDLSNGHAAVLNDYSNPVGTLLY